MSYERVEQCPVCGKSDFRPKMVVEDYSVSHESFAIVQCTSCGFQLTNPRPDAQSIGRYYESEDYVSHSDTSKGLTNKLYQLARLYTMRHKVKLVNKMAPRRGYLLDYGCGTGYFLEACQKVGWQVSGIEPSDVAREQARQRTGQPIGAHDLGQFAPGSFDAITLWHVLEHVHTLNETLAQLTQLLKPDGVLIIAVPNAESPDAQYYREQWAAYDVPRHLYHFTPQTIGKLLRKHRMQVRHTLPLVLDAYYVSMLSERYRAERDAGLLAAFKAGYKSNQQAAQHGGQYSSLIYVAGKTAAASAKG
ncbi:class I SAM-dependent methyltransferase [Hymenobacter busanensis]|uniref:Class I SAM-dependent methyltransferase n=1 Tax=Hymenobacter busanensis TaxID=2607656 RepID=A0A7L5A024_9BACT|nr:class I SAM-dependent methyltransferase [Hymenobacter busanensis]KAA9332961.1 class I SAM-dependent methyltransferase [Hymenobacter busanensis]QHJ08365.1 methyltransferase domain-containing protein [Hymenobacter busanensis]